MTTNPHSLRRLLPLALLAVVAVTPLVCHALPDGVVAIVGKKKPLHLKFDGFCVAAAQQCLPDLLRSKGGPRNVLEQIIEEEMVRQECKRLGLVVTKADVDRTWNELDGRLRTASNGERTLRDAIRKEGQTEREFRKGIWHQEGKKKIAQHASNLGRLPSDENTQIQQIGIVIGQLRTRTDVKYGVMLVDHAEANVKPAKLAPGVVATVNRVPITRLTWGRALVMRLPSHRVRDMLERECKTALMRDEDIRLTDAELAEEMEHLAELWTLERELLREEVWRTVAFEDRFKTIAGVSVEDVKQSRYNRGLLGLVRMQRSLVTDKQIEEEFERNRETRYGSHIVVSDIEIKFAQRKGLMADASPGATTRRRALEEAKRVLRLHASGVPFEKIISDINKRNPMVLPRIRAQRIRLYQTDRDRILYNQAARMSDGSVSSPFETLSEVHVMRREGVRPPRTRGEVIEYVRETLARRMARDWLEERIKDTSYVRMAWPLPQRGDPLPK